MGTAAGVTNFLRTARQRARRDQAGGPRRRRRSAGAHRTARRTERAASGARQDHTRRPTTPRPTNAPPTTCCCPAMSIFSFTRSRPAWRWTASSRIKALLVETKSGRGAMLGRVFIDCSGDGDLAAFAGAALRKRRRRRPHAFPDDDVPRERRRCRRWPARPGAPIPALMDAAEKRGVAFPRKGAIVRPQKHSNEWRVNVTQIKNPDGRAVDGTDARELSAGEIDGRRQAHGVLRISAARGAGVRQILHGRHPAAARHARDAPRSPDATSSPPTTSSDLRQLSRHHRGQRLADREPCGGGRGLALAGNSGVSRGFNHLPYRMLVPVALDNLLVAGRCASMSA